MVSGSPGLVPGLAWHQAVPEGMRISRRIVVGGGEGMVALLTAMAQPQPQPPQSGPPPRHGGCSVGLIGR